MSTSFVFVTGATSGIGLAIAREFAKLGKNLVLVGRRAERLASIRDQFVREYGVEVRTFAADVSDRTGVDAVFDSLADIEIEALVNNA
jgi:short-subunit dehydrogenase